MKENREHKSTVSHLYCIKCAHMTNYRYLHTIIIMLVRYFNGVPKQHCKKINVYDTTSPIQNIYPKNKNVINKYREVNSYITETLCATVSSYINQ